MQMHLDKGETQEAEAAIAAAAVTVKEDEMEKVRITENTSHGLYLVYPKGNSWAVTKRNRTS